MSSTAAQFSVPPNVMMVPERPRPGQSLMASAQRLTKERVKGQRLGVRDWQSDAWDMFDLVGEEHFLVTMLAGRLAQARLYVGKIGDDVTQPPIREESGPAFDAFEQFAPGNRSQLLNRMAISLSIAGELWLAGVPRSMLTKGEEDAEQGPARPRLLGLPPEGLPDETDLSDLEWHVVSVSEISSQGGKVQLKIGAAMGEVLEVDPSEVFLVRVWRPHPRHVWEADSPARASLPVLHELVSLTMNISAQIDSRLAGAGIFLVPSSAARAVRTSSGLGPDDVSDPFTEALIEAMMTAIRDRASASAVVPLVITVPDESIPNFRHISFSTPLDGTSSRLRDESIRRLALGQDAPPELLLGTGGMSHWGSWLIREDVVTTHLEPPLALICDALTTQYLRPVLEATGMDDDEISQYAVWYDVSHLITRPNRFTDAQALYEKGVISAQAYRDAGNFTDGEAPEEEGLPMPVRMALDMVQENPGLIASPGLGSMVEQLTALFAGQAIPPPPGQAPADPDPEEDETIDPEADEDTPSGDGNPPATDESTADPDAGAPE